MCDLSLCPWFSPLYPWWFPSAEYLMCQVDCDCDLFSDRWSPRVSLSLDPTLALIRPATCCSLIEKELLNRTCETIEIKYSCQVWENWTASSVSGLKKVKQRWKEVTGYSNCQDLHWWKPRPYGVFMQYYTHFDWNKLSASCLRVYAWSLKSTNDRKVRSKRKGNVQIYWNQSRQLAGVKINVLECRSEYHSITMQQLLLPGNLHLLETHMT